MTNASWYFLYNCYFLVAKVGIWHLFPVDFLCGFCTVFMCFLSKVTFSCTVFVRFCVNISLIKIKLSHPTFWRHLSAHRLFHTIFFGQM